MELAFVREPPQVLSKGQLVVRAHVVVEGRSDDGCDCRPEPLFGLRPVRLDALEPEGEEVVDDNSVVPGRSACLPRRVPAVYGKWLAACTRCWVPLCVPLRLAV